MPLIILHQTATDSDLLRLGADLVPVLFLSHISEEAHNLIVLVKEPAQDCAGVEAAFTNSQSLESEANLEHTTLPEYARQTFPFDMVYMVCENWSIE